jgi:hypothetical protein
MLSNATINGCRALAARIPMPRRAVGAGGQAGAGPLADSNARRVIPRLIRAAMAGAMGLAAVDGERLSPARRRRPPVPAPRARCTR